MSEYILWLLVIAYGAHVMEEYILDWKNWVRQLTGVTMEWSDFFLVNAVVVVTGISFAMIGYKYPYLSLIFPALMMINAVFCHVLPAIAKQVYSPGLLTSAALFIPLSILAFYEAYKLNVLNWKLLLITFAGGLVIMIYPFLLQIIKLKVKK